MSVPVYRFILHPGQLAPRGWSCCWAACPPGVKIPQGILPPTLGSLPPGVKLPLGSLPPRGEDTLAWAACPPPQENLTELNAGRFYVFKIKILRNMGKLIFTCVCICIFFLVWGNWGPEYSGLRSLHLCQKTWQTPFWKIIYHLIDFPIKQSFEYS